MAPIHSHKVCHSWFTICRRLIFDDIASAPEEDYISVHIRVVGDFTSALAKSVGCEFESKSEKESPAGGKVVPPPLNRVLPRVMVDGPFGSASEDFLKFETVLLVGGGIGVTPFAS